MVTWFLVAGIATGITAVALGISLIEPLPQSVGSLSATIYILLLAWQFGWLRASGIGSLGNIKAWLVALIAFIYLVAAHSLAFYGDFTIQGNAFISCRHLQVGRLELR
jgi:hypothetical protein